MSRSISHHRLVAILLSYFILIVPSAFAYTTFRNRLSFRPSNKNLETFCETVWHVATHHDDSPPPNKAPLLPGQECDAPFPNLQPVIPFHNVKDYASWSKKLMDQYQVVQQELLNYLRHQEEETQDSKNNNNDDIDWSTSNTALCENTNGFSKLTLVTTDKKPTSVAQQWFPQTLELLSEADGVFAPRPICINAQAPQTGLAPHSDNMNFLLTCHLGLIIPDDDCCHMFMRAPHHEVVSYSWKEGKLVICDTSFVHWTSNDSKTRQSRYVLSFSIWHPGLTVHEQEGILQIHEALQETDGGDALPQREG